MNKMYFYYFLCVFPPGSTGGTGFSCLLCRLSPLLVAHPGARTWCHALPWWAFSLLAILADCKQPKTKIL